MSHDLVCSASGCRAAASWSLQWNNPRIHEPQRRKVWLACDEHKDSLAQFLGKRSFLKDIEPLSASSAETGAGSAADR